MSRRNVSPAALLPAIALACLIGAASTTAAGDMIGPQDAQVAQARTSPQQIRTEGAPTIRIARVHAEPRLDDVASGRIADDMTKISGFVQREPRDGAPVSRETTAYLGYDDRNFYAVFVCKEDPRIVRAHMAKRESIMGDDIVALILDTFHDRRHAYEFIVNPLGIQLDGVTTEGQNDDYSFDTLWRSEGRLTADGYVVRIAVPFRSLRFSNARVQEWGVTLGRILPTRNETSFWPHITRQLSGFGEQLATLTGLENISPGRNVQFIPYGAFTGARFLDQSAGTYGSTREGRAGLDAKMVIRDALTLDVAANPDFSQVESDEPQVTINQRFEVQFPEKRPFFIENAAYFTTPEQLFFSRRIADPSFGARMTGSVGQWNVAGLVMDDRAPGQQAGAASGLQGRSTVVGMARVARQFARQSTAGFLVTDREFGGTFNRVFSADTRLRFGDHWIASGEAITSRTRRTDGTSAAGDAFLGDVSYTSRELNFGSSYTDRSPDFHTDVGFVPRSDIRLWDNQIRYRRYTKSKRILSFGPFFEGSVNWDHRQRLQEWTAAPNFQIELPASTELQVFASRSYELYREMDFDKHQAGFYFSSEWFNWLSGSLTYNRGTAVNYYPSAGQLPFLADSREINLGVTIKPRARLRVEETYIFDRLWTRADVARALTPAASIFGLHLFRTKANYQFTRELSARVIIDYNVLDPNAALVALERDRRLTADILVTYLLNPGTALYVGVTDAYANLRLDPMVSPALVRTDSATTSSIGRQLFAKVSYLLRF